MNEQKEARPDVGAPERVVETGPASQAGPYLHQQFTTAPPSGQGFRVADYLLPGQQKAVPLRHLKDLLHLDGRKVRLMIRAERLAGKPILADNQAGYYLPGNDHERARCVQSMRRRAAEIVKAADAIERGAQ